MGDFSMIATGLPAQMIPLTGMLNLLVSIGTKSLQCTKFHLVSENGRDLKYTTTF